MKTRLAALVFVLAVTPRLARANHHHGGEAEPAPECVRWEADAYDAGMDAGAADAGTTTTEVVTDAGAADAGDHAGEHCVETAPARGCGLGGGGASAAGLLFAGFALRRRPGA